MKTSLLFTIAGIFVLSTLQVFSSVPAGLNPEMPSETQLANGKVLTVKVLSAGMINNMLGDTENRKVSIYLPPGYDENGNSYYPVIYMLSDVNGTNEDWFQTFSESNFPEVLDKSIKSGTIKPVILVFPDGKNKVGGSWYTNSEVSGNWEDFIVNDVVSYVDHYFRTLPFADSRGIAGKGMGAYGALKMATKYPGIFSAVYSLNALVDFETLINQEYIWGNSFKVAAEAIGYPTGDAFANRLLAMSVAFAPDPNKSTVKGNLPKSENGEIIKNVFEKWLNQDPLQMIQENTGNLKALKAITVDCSTSNAEIMLSGNYADALTKAGINHTFSFFSGNENIDLLNRVTGVMLPMFDKNLAHSLLEFDAKPCYTYSDVLKVSMIADGNVHVVPLNNNTSLQSSESITSVDEYVKANTEIEISLANLDKGIYKIYGISKDGFIGKSYLFGVNGGTPLVKICVTESHTGEMISTCQMTVNGMTCIPNENGEHCFNAEGEITVCMKKENYSDLTKSVTIYTDTTINVALVKDSYLQVVERGIGKPLFEAMVTQNNKATLTDNGGFTTVQNIQNGILECRIFKSGYFTEDVNMPLAPGKTAVVELTPKTADVDFVLVSEQGHLDGITIQLGDLLATSDQFGRVKFANVDTRKVYSYSVTPGITEATSGSVYLQTDTVLVIEVWTKNDNSGTEKNLSVAYIAEKSKQLVTGSREDIEREIMIYPNPATSFVTVQTSSIKGFTVELRSETGALLQKTKIEGTLHRINLSNLSNGVYFVTVKSDNFYRTQRIMKL